MMGHPAIAESSAIEHVHLGLKNLVKDQNLEMIQHSLKPNANVMKMEQV